MNNFQLTQRWVHATVRELYQTPKDKYHIEEKQKRLQDPRVQSHGVKLKHVRIKKWRVCDCHEVSYDIHETNCNHEKREKKNWRYAVSELETSDY